MGNGMPEAGAWHVIDRITAERIWNGARAALVKCLGEPHDNKSPTGRRQIWRWTAWPPEPGKSWGDQGETDTLEQAQAAADVALVSMGWALCGYSPKLRLEGAKLAMAAWDQLCKEDP